MASVDAELCWGDERLHVAAHPLGAAFGPGGPFGAMAPIALDGDDVILVVPPRCRAWIHTANGWRDLHTLRILGCVAPDPAILGAARVRMRRLEEVDGLASGIAVVRRVEAWLERDGYWLRVGLSEDAGPAPRIDRRAVRSLAALAAFTITLFAGALTALGAVPPRRPTLDVTRLGPPMARLLPVVVTPPDPTSRVVETKHRVDRSERAGGRSLGDVMAPARPTPRRAPAGRAGVDGAGARRPPPDPTLPHLRAAVTALQSLGLGDDPFARAEPSTGERLPLGDREDWLRLATLRGSCGTLADARVLSASRPGPLAAGWGDDWGRRRITLPPPVRAHATMLSGATAIPQCERRWECGGRWSCRPCGAAPIDEAAVIRQVVREHLGDLRFCYEQGRLRVPALAGRITLRWRIDSDGAPSRAEVIEDELGDAITTACMRAAPEGWRFEGVGQSTVTFPFVFRAL